MRKQILISKFLICMLSLLSIQIFSQPSMKFVKSFKTKNNITLSPPAFSSDGKFIYASGNDILFKWSINSEFPVKEIKIKEEHLFLVATTPDGKYILVGGKNKLYLCDPESLEIINSSDDFRGRKDITIAPNSEIAYVDGDLINISSLAKIVNVGHPLQVNANFSEDSTVLYCMSGSSTFRITDIGNPKSGKMTRFKDDREGYNMVITPDESTLIIGVGDAYGLKTLIKLVDIKTGEEKDIIDTTEEYGEYARPLTLIPGYPNKVLYWRKAGVFILDYKTYESKSFGYLDAYNVSFSNDGKVFLANRQYDKSFSLYQLK